MASTALPKIVKVQTVSFPIGTTAGKKSVVFDLPSDYKTVRGFYCIRNFGTDYLKITVKDSNGVNVLDPVNIAHLNGTTSQLANPVEIDKKFSKATPFEANGRKMTLEVDVYATTVAVQEFDFIYECDNHELEEKHNH